MISIPKLRKAAFAMIRKIGLDDDGRYAIHASLGLPESSKDFGLSDWEILVARLQQLTGRPDVRYGVPQLLHDGRDNPRLPDGLDVTATPGQIAYIRDLASQIVWRDPTGLHSLIVRNWPKDRAESERDQWARHGTVDTLDRAVANRVIPALKRMAAREVARALAAAD